MKDETLDTVSPDRAPAQPPRILIVDDLFGRVQNDGRNPERVDLCGQFLIEDVTGDLEPGRGSQKIKNPTAQGVFFRGQTPTRASLGSMVENDLEATLAFVRQHWQNVGHTSPVSMLLLDLCFYTGPVTPTSESRRGKGMPEGRDGDDQPAHYYGLRVLEALHADFPDLPVIILSSMPRDSVSQRFSRLGALGFLPRGGGNSPLLLREYLGRHGLIPDTSGTVVGSSKPVLLALRAARRAAANRKNVLIRGETGTGKELLARYLHDHTPDGKSTPLVTVDSGTLNPSLYASELFGHKRGAFTGATSDRIGRVVQANGGDLFLDEIGNMPQDVQVGLLRAIEEKEVTPLGSSKSHQCDVRFVTATNRDIEEMASTGQGFREDLYYRLREGGTVCLPPLRERKEDIPLLSERFVREAEAATASAMRRTIDTQAMDALMLYDWPGNVRELRSCIFKAVNDHPDVEYLANVHLHLPGSPDPKPRGRGSPSPQQLPPPHSEMSCTGELGSLFDDLGVEALRPGDLAGKLPSVARLVLRLVLAAVNVTRRRTLQHPEGEILIHPAMKLLSGNANLTASQAADLVKRVMKLYPEAIHDILSDDTLAEVSRIAYRLRPTESYGASRKPQRRVGRKKEHPETTK